ncbi:MAG: hypothetical protein ACTSWY_10640, partial [Promethearchaeota archaeon]
RTYELSVIAYNCNGNSSESNVCIISIIYNPVPSTPTIFSSSENIFNGNITINWTESEYSAGYFIFINGTLNSTTEFTSKEYFFPAENKTYELTVIAFNRNGNSTESNSCVITIIYSPIPSTPTIFAISEDNINRIITINWTESKYADGYYILINGTVNKTTCLLSTEFMFPMQNMTYELTAIAYNCNGNSTESNPHSIKVIINTPELEPIQIPEKSSSLNMGLLILGGIISAFGAVSTVGSVRKKLYNKGIFKKLYNKMAKNINH